VAQILGDSIMMNAVIVGGFVPALLYQNVEPLAETGAHVGTRDLDLAMDLVVLEKERYDNVVSCLREHGFAPEINENGNQTRQRWQAKSGAQVDFLMPPVPPDTSGGRQQSLTADFAAFTMPGLDIALKHRVIVSLNGKDLAGRTVERELPVCAPHVFIALKALAMANRHRPKDAYDIHYVLLHDNARPTGLGEQLNALRPHPAIDEAVKVLHRDYKVVDGRGPSDVSGFLEGNTDLAASALAYMLDFLKPLKT